MASIVEWIKKIIGFFHKSPESPQALEVSPETLGEQIEKWKKAIEAHPNDPKAHFGLGSVYVKLQRYKEALRPLKEVLRLEPGHMSAHYMLGKALVECGRDEDAVDSLAYAHQKNPESQAIRKLLAEAHKNLMVSYGKMKWYEESMKHFKEATQVVPDCGPAHLALGINYDQLGRKDEAIEKFKQATRMDQNLIVEANYHLGNIYSKLGEYKKAMKYYKEAIAVNPKAALCHMNLGYLYFKMERYKDAVECIQTAFTFSPKLTTDAPFKLGLALLRLGRDREAVAPLKKAMKLSPGDPVVQESLVTAYVRIAETCRKSGQIGDAAAVLQRAVELDPENVGLHVQLSEDFDRIPKGVDAVVHATIAKQLYIEKRDQDAMVQTMRRLAALYKKYKFKQEDFVNVKVPRKRH